MDEVRLDIGELTAGELELIEEHAGIEALNAALSGRTSVKAAAVLLWIAWRRQDPTVTLERVRALKLAEMPRLVIVGGDEQANPTDAAG